MSHITPLVSPSALIEMFGAERSVHAGEKREKESSISSTRKLVLLLDVPVP